MLGLSTIQAAAIGAVLVLIASLGGYAWDADRALKRDRAALVEAKRDLAAVTATLERERADARARRDSDAKVRLLPEDRVRLCATRGPADPCCQPTGECRP